VLAETVVFPGSITVVAMVSWASISMSEAMILRLSFSATSMALARIGMVFRRSTTDRSEEHTSELQSLMRISYAVFCLNKKKAIITKHNTTDRSQNNSTE